MLTGTVDPAKAFAGFANSERASGRGRLPGGECGGEVRTRTPHQPARGERIRAVHARIGLQHLSHRCPDRAGVSEQYARVLYPIILSLAQSAGSRPEDADRRRLGGYLMFCGMAKPASVSPGALAHGHLRYNPIGAVGLAAQLA